MFLSEEMYSCVSTVKDTPVYKHLNVMQKSILNRVKEEALLLAIHSKHTFVTLTVIHVILVAVSQRLVTLPCSDMVCWLAFCVHRGMHTGIRAHDK